MSLAAKYITSQLRLSRRAESSTRDHTIFIVPVKWQLFIFAVIICCTACNSSKQNTAGTSPAAVKQQPKVILPQQPVATPAGVSFVYDNENIFTPTEEKSLDSLVRNFEKSNLISIKIATLNDPSVTAASFNQRNKALLDEWSAIHGKSEKCMVISISKELPMISIDYGTFVSRLLSDDEAKAIIEHHFKPSFKEGRYYDGTRNGVTALMNTIRSNIKF